MADKKITINIKEKSIMAVVKNKINDNKILLLDENGNTISHILSNKFDHLPIIEDSDHPEKVIPIYRYLKDNSIPIDDILKNPLNPLVVVYF